MRHIHPFPARMAPEILLNKLTERREVTSIWDPMCGSGTTLRVAQTAGIRSVGTDLDPLAIKISRTGTRNYCEQKVASALDVIIQTSKQIDVVTTDVVGCAETEQFKSFWFAEPQRHDLELLSRCIGLVDDEELREFFEVAMSRLIITKFRGASLAWDVSHSRPHRKKVTNDYDVLQEFLKSCEKLLNLCNSHRSIAPASVSTGDARTYNTSERYDLIATSPPYFNAIDYMRGHKFSLVWMGWTIPALRQLRSSSIGAERILPREESGELEEILDYCLEGEIDREATRGKMLRYVQDCASLLKNFTRSLATTGRVILVLADSRVRGSTLRSNLLFQRLGELHGLRHVATDQREIEPGKRYLPLNAKGLSDRMKNEWIMEFAT